MVGSKKQTTTKKGSFISIVICFLLLLWSSHIFAQYALPRLDSLYFYESHAKVSKVIHGKKKYGFVNKNKKLVIDYLYDHTSGFNTFHGYASARLGKSNYMIDTVGNKFPLAEQIEDLNDSITALSFVSKKKMKLPKEILQNPQLKILILRGGLDLTGIKNLPQLEVLDLSKTGIRDVPLEIFALKNLRVLNLHSNQIKSIPPEIGKLKKLERLNLLYNKHLKSFPLEIGELANLEVLKLNSHILPKEIAKLKNLTEIKISGGKFPDGMENLTQLKSLSIVHVDSVLPSFLGNLHNLEYLQLHLFPQKYKKNYNIDLSPLEKISQLKSLTISSGNGNPSLIFETGKLKQLEELKFLDTCDSIPELEGLKKLTHLHLHSPPKNFSSVVSNIKSLKCLRINNIPDKNSLEGIGNLENLEWLHLRFRKNPATQELPEGIWNLKKLKHLELQTFSGKIPEGIAQLTNLEILRGLPIEGFPNGYRQLKKVVQFSLRASDYEQLKADLSKIRHAEILNIYGELEVLPKEIGELSNLKLLEIKMPISVLPDEIANLKNLKELYINNDENPSKSYPGRFDADRKTLIVPASIGKLDALEELSMPKCNITRLPDEIGRLKKLKKLRLFENCLKELPNSLTNLENLEQLSLDNNFITKLPDEIGKLTQLTSLNLTNNQLNELPESIGNLSNLKGMQVSDNPLKSLPESFGKLKTLSSLNLNGSNFSEGCPKEIFKLEELEYLNLASCEIASLPGEIKNLTKLKILFLHDNKISKLPNTISKLKRLNTLNISKNNLNKLPALSGMKYLRTITLRGNHKIVNLTEAVKGLEKLEELTIPKEQKRQIDNIREVVHKFSPYCRIY